MRNHTEGAGTRFASPSNIEAELQTWSDAIDQLVLGYLAAGAWPHDTYRLRVEALRHKHTAVQTRFNAFKATTPSETTWRSFRAGLTAELKALESDLAAVSSAIEPQPTAAHSEQHPAAHGPRRDL